VSLQVVDRVIELLDGLIAAVYHGVEQAVGEAADLVGAVDKPGVEVPVRRAARRPGRGGCGWDTAAGSPW
jgi:hypothetical protein